jgi:hypothetical protein
MNKILYNYKIYNWYWNKQNIKLNIYNIDLFFANKYTYDNVWKYSIELINW